MFLSSVVSIKWCSHVLTTCDTKWTKANPWFCFFLSGGILQYLEAWKALQKQRLENPENHTNLFALQLPVQKIISNRHSTQKATSTPCAKENET